MFGTTIYLSIVHKYLLTVSIIPYLSADAWPEREDEIDAPAELLHSIVLYIHLLSWKAWGRGYMHVQADLYCITTTPRE